MSCYFEVNVKSKFNNRLESNEFQLKIMPRNIIVPTFLGIIYILFTILNFDGFACFIMTLVSDWLKNKTEMNANLIIYVWFYFGDFLPYWIRVPVSCSYAILAANYSFVW